MKESNKHNNMFIITGDLYKTINVAAVKPGVFCSHWSKGHHIRIRPKIRPQK